MAGHSPDSGRSVTSKVVAILLTFTNGNVHTLTEIARLTGLPPSTAHRLIGELAAWGILERTGDGTYRAGVQWRMACGNTPAAPSSIREQVRRVMEDLAVATARTNRLGVLDVHEVIYIEKCSGTRPVSTLGEGATAPAHATAMGKALLAFSPPRTVDLVIAHGMQRYTPHTVTSPEELRRSLAVTRLTRFAITKRELDMTISAIAVPVFGWGGEVVAALEVETPDPRDLRRMQPALIMASRSLSREFTAAHNWGQFALTRQHRGNSFGNSHPARSKEMSRAR
jgi:DNA-binding IclR family transcriptional regulator